MNRPAVPALILLGGVLAAAPAPASLPPLVPHEVLFADVEQDAPEISPDGRWLLGKLGGDGVVKLWVRGLEGDTAPRHVGSPPRRQPFRMKHLVVEVECGEKTSLLDPMGLTPSRPIHSSWPRP